MELARLARATRAEQRHRAWCARARRRHLQLVSELRVWCAAARLLCGCVAEGVLRGVGQRLGPGHARAPSGGYTRTALGWVLAPVYTYTLCRAVQHAALVPCCGRCWPAWLCDGARCSCARPRPLLDAHVHGGGSARRTRSRVPCCGCAGSAAASCDQRMRTATPSAQLATARRVWLRAGQSTSPRSTRAHPVRSHAHTPLSHPHPTHCTQSCTHFHH